MSRRNRFMSNAVPRGGRRRTGLALRREGSPVASRLLVAPLSLIRPALVRLWAAIWGSCRATVCIGGRAAFLPLAVVLLLGGAGSSPASAQGDTGLGWGWGFCSDQNTTIGNGLPDGCYRTPTGITGIDGAIAIASSPTNMNLALMPDGTVRMWGRNAVGQPLRPVAVPGLDAVTAIGTGYSWGMAVSRGAVWSWGRTPSGSSAMAPRPPAPLRCRRSASPVWWRSRVRTGPASP